MTRQEMAEQCRKDLKNALGEAFASKASDDLCLRLAHPVFHAAEEAAAGGPAAPEAFALEAGGPAAGGGTAPQPVVIEMDDGDLQEARDHYGALQRSMTSVAGALPEGMSEGMSEGDRSRMTANLRRSLRTTASEELRSRFDDLSRSVRQRLQEDASAGPEGGGMGSAVPFVRSCWLNRTVGTETFTPALAEVASADEVRALDVPRPLQREVTTTACLIGVPPLRDQLGVDGAEVVVAVIDSEVEMTHARLVGRVVSKGNFTAEGWGSPGSHGTAVAGIIHELAPGATIWNYKVFARLWWMDSNEFGGTLAIQQALEDGAQVANCSWGAGPATDGSSRAARACDTAWSLGMAVVKSAGNKGAEGAGTLTTPADAEGVIVVGGTDRAGSAVGSYSSRGPTGDGRERPHLVAPGGTEGPGNRMHSTLLGNDFGEMPHPGFGTSYAAPHVTAAIALLLQHDAELLPDDLRDRLRSCCSPLDGFTGNDQGAGLLNLTAISQA